MRDPYAAVLLVCCCASSSASAGAHELDLLKTVREGHSAAVGSIRTLSCRYTSKMSSQGGILETGEYWRSPESVRVRARNKSPAGEHNSEAWVSEARKTWLVDARMPDGRRRMSAGVVPRLDHEADEVWSKALLTFYGPKASVLTFEELLARPHKLTQVKHVTEGERALVYVDLTHEKARLELWFDPAVNYLVRKLIMRTPPPEGDGVALQRADYVVARFKEVAPAVFFPEQVDVKIFAEGRLVLTTTNTLSDFLVNQPLPPDVFTVRLPPGVEVTDSIEGKVFIVGADGRLSVVPGKQVATSPALPASAAGSTWQTQTQTESLPLTRWILPSSVVVLVLAVVLWCVRRWRRVAR